jgi:methyl-accepting chemotaxis protein
MSATAEELAAQSEQLQANIAYFRLAESAPRAPMAARARPALPALSAPKRRTERHDTPSPGPSKPPVVRKGASGQTAGFALALADGADAHDREFESY